MLYRCQTNLNHNSRPFSRLVQQDQSQQVTVNPVAQLPQVPQPMMVTPVAQVPHVFQMPLQQAISTPAPVQQVPVQAAVPQLQVQNQNFMASVPQFYSQEEVVDTRLLKFGNTT